jgi:tetratricopeptide (TPR) repeat protein
MTTALLGITIAIVVIVLLLYMLAQKTETNVQQLIQQHRYAEAAALPATDSAGFLHRAEALKLLGRFEEAIDAYGRSTDPAAREGIALSLAHIGRDLDRARVLMDQTMAAHPQIQEFQALGLAFILLRSDRRDEALRLFEDNAVLLQTRFQDDYTDPDPLLAETLVLYAELSEAAGDRDRAAALRRQAAAWAPASVWADQSARR